MPVVVVAPAGLVAVGAMAYQVMVAQVAAERRKRVPTGEINRFLKTVDFQRASVPMSKRVKILYMTQVATAPPTFVLFTDRAVKLHFSYERFLENQIRRAFGFTGIHLEDDAHLFQVVLAACATGRFAGARQCRQEDRREHGTVRRSGAMMRRHGTPGSGSSGIVPPSAGRHRHRAARDFARDRVSLFGRRDRSGKIHLHGHRQRRPRP